VFHRLGESIPDTLHKGDHVLVDGQLVSSKYERENGKSKKGKAAKATIFWTVRANSVPRLFLFVRDSCQKKKFLALPSRIMEDTHPSLTAVRWRRPALPATGRSS